MTDKVHYGFRLGHKLERSTINMRFADGVLVPRHGVYAAKVHLDSGERLMAATNVGVRPTVSGGDRVSVESYILDYEATFMSAASEWSSTTLSGTRRNSRTPPLRGLIQRDGYQGHFAETP
ncbi:MAG: riboflavin kinase [Lachnospiraceae bacterium]